MLKIQILTKNNSKTINDTFDSISQLKAKVLVGDFGSHDETIDICKKRGAVVFNFKNITRDSARNKLIKESEHGPYFYIEPWESIVQGHSFLLNNKINSNYVKLINGKIITQEIRIWDGDKKFINPIYERIDVDFAEFSPIILYSNGKLDEIEVLDCIKNWKLKNPTDPSPYYYHACVLFSQGKYEDFINMADQYMFFENKETFSKVMIRYYYAMTMLIYKKSYKPALQNINLCLCAKPLMAEFWCLMADVYYHLLNKFSEAKFFYENAIFMGSRRMKNDVNPIDLDKYKAYPNKMIKSCDQLLQQSFVRNQ